MSTDPITSHPEPGPDDRTDPTTGSSRRRFLQGTGVAAGALALSGIAGTGRGYAATESRHGLPKGFKGDMSDLKHVVILMQENRSTDHYFGTFPAYAASTTSRRCGSRTAPPSSSRRTAAATSSLPKVDDGTWGNDHGAWGDVNHRKWDLWVKHNGASCMNYHSDAYMGFYHSVAAQYTIADQYFCSEFGPTDPNRKYLWSGTANSETGNDRRVQLLPPLDHGRRATPAGRHRLAALLRQQRQRATGLHQFLDRRLRRQRAEVLQGLRPRGAERRRPEAAARHRPHLARQCDLLLRHDLAEQRLRREPGRGPEGLP